MYEHTKLNQREYEYHNLHIQKTHAIRILFTRNTLYLNRIDSAAAKDLFLPSLKNIIISKNSPYRAAHNRSPILINVNYQGKNKIPI